MKRKTKYKIYYVSFCFVSAWFAFFPKFLLNLKTLKLDSLKANFPPGERYFSLGKRDPFVPLVGPE